MKRIDFTSFPFKYSWVASMIENGFFVSFYLCVIIISFNNKSKFPKENVATNIKLVNKEN